MLSQELEAIRPPSGEKATERTVLECFLSGPKAKFPVCASQTMIVASNEPETIYFLSGENMAQQTVSICPRNVRVGEALSGQSEPCLTEAHNEGIDAGKATTGVVLAVVSGKLNVLGMTLAVGLWLRLGSSATCS